MGSYTVKYDYANATYQSKSVLALTTTSTVNGVTSSSVSYVDPSTGAAIANGSSTADLVTTYTPADYESRLYNAVTTVGQKATVNVKARQSGKSITDAFQTIGGGTALNMDYSYTVERKPNETLAVAGANYSTCKLQIDVTISNISLEGANTGNAFYALMFPTLSAAFAAPFKNTIWLSNQLPNVAKVYQEVNMPAPYGTATSTMQLTSKQLSPR